jgi:signal transduction histidine kinase
MTVMLFHVVLLPILYLGIDRAVVRTHSELFVAVARTYVQRRVSEFNAHAASMSPAQLREFADDIMASGLVVYSVVEWNGQTIQRFAPGNRVTDIYQHEEPDQFGEGDDHIYHVVVPVHAGVQSGKLRFGFDEFPIVAHIAEARRLVFTAMFAYLVMTLAAALLLARRLAAPLEALRKLATQIAAGNLRRGIAVESGILELNELATSLERMRAELISNTEKLNMKQRLETVGTLAGGVAHEFNNILVPITIFTESALKSLAADHVAHPWLERAVGAAHRARDVIGKLLLFGGRSPPPDLTEINVAPAISEAVRLFESLRPSTVLLELRIEPATDPIVANRGQIVQVVMNLCTNAFHAIPQTGGKISISLRNVYVGDGRFVELAVADDGIGMDDATVHRIFEPFFTTRAVGQGTGLGLSLVHGILASMGASIEVMSAPNRGTTFTILFPSAVAAGRAQELEDVSHG